MSSAMFAQIWPGLDAIKRHFEHKCMQCHKTMLQGLCFIGCRLPLACSYLMMPTALRTDLQLAEDAPKTSLWCRISSVLRIRHPSHRHCPCRSTPSGLCLCLWCRAGLYPAPPWVACSVCYSPVLSAWSYARSQPGRAATGKTPAPRAMRSWGLFRTPRRQHLHLLTILDAAFQATGHPAGL